MLNLNKFNWSNLKDYTNLYNQINSLNSTARCYDQNSIKKILNLPGVDPESNLNIAYWNDNPIGFNYIQHENYINRIVFTGGVIKQYQRRGIGKLLLTRALEELRSYSGYVCHIQAGKQETGLIELLANLEFHPVNEYLKMILKKPELVKMNNTSDYIIETFQQGEDEKLLTDIQNDVFRGSWGFAPNTIDEISARMNLDRAEPQGVLFVRKVQHQSKSVVAYCWTLRSQNPHGHVGWISMVGCTPQNRGKGVGRIATVAGINYLAEQGVDEIELEVAARNKPAIELYRNLGFKFISDTQWFEKTL